MALGIGKWSGAEYKVSTINSYLKRLEIFKKLIDWYRIEG